MTQKREKGKIPHSEWRKITARYEGGETIAQIGRDYACTAPAIRYIIKRSGKLRSDTAAGDKPRVEVEATAMRKRHTADKVVDRDAGQTVARDSISATRGGGIDSDLRKRVTADVASFLVALDQASADVVESLNVLQEATDCLMRSASRIRIEIERSHDDRAGGTNESDARQRYVRAGLSHR
jgi:hypothetical protein